MGLRALLMDKKNIINDIKSLRTITMEPNLAYALRVKIFRQTIKLLQDISQLLGLPKPDRLEEIKEEDMNPEINNIYLSYNSIVEISLSLSQPSESLDEEWSSKWNKFLEELQRLEKSLKRFKTS